MRSTTKTRVQRRVEKKQAVLLVALVLVSSVVSFVLGIVVGRHNIEPAVVQQVSEPQRTTVDGNLIAPAEQVAAVDKPVEEKLSFYDNLSKEEMAPIGSGINLPPDSGVSASEKMETARPQLSVEQRAGSEIVALVKEDLSPVTLPATKSSVVAVAPPAAVPTKGMPPVVKGGEWVVQVFSSRSAADAGMLRDELGGKGYPAFISEADLGKKGIWYRVLIGPYADRPASIQAQTYAAEKDKLKGFAKRR